MARHVWSVLCERALVDQDTQSVSMIDVIEELLLEGELPAGRVDVPLQASLVTYWTRSAQDAPEQGQSRLRVLSPMGEALASGKPSDVSLREQTRAQVVSRIDSMPLEGEGVYQLVIDLRGEQDTDWSEAGRVPLEVRVQKPITGSE